MTATGRPTNCAPFEPGAIVETARGDHRLLTAKQVAAWLGVSVCWVMQHASGHRRPFLPSVKLGRAVRFQRASVESFIVACERFAHEAGLVSC